MMFSSLNRSFLTQALILAGLLSPQVNALDLQQAISETLANNPQVLTELREVDARNRGVRGALGDFYPDIDLVAGFGFQERDPVAQVFPNGRTRNELERHEAQLTVRQLVFDGFNTWNQYQSEKTRETSARHRAESVAEEVALEVVRAYLNVLKREEILRLAEQTYAFHQEIHEKMRKRYESGVGSRADFDQISGRLALSRTNFFNAQANLLDAKTGFQRVVGRFPETGELRNPGSYRNYLPESVESAVQRAVANHPILKVAEADIQGVEYQYEQTKSSYYPKFYIDVERDLNSNIDGVEGQVDDLKVMLRMNYTLYNGRSNQARKQEFAYLVEKAREIRNNARRQVEQEVRLAWVAYNTISEQIPFLESYVKDTVKTREAYLDQYDLGRRTLLDLLNTETETVNARQSLINAQHDLIFNEYRIFQSLGDLTYMVGVKI